MTPIAGTNGIDLDALRVAALAWRDDDPGPTTRREIDDLLALVEADKSEAGEAAAQLADRFSGLLEFGTAGLRGAIGAGPSRMNRSVVIRAAAGLTTYLQREVAIRTSVVVIGYEPDTTPAVEAAAPTFGEGPDHRLRKRLADARARASQRLSSICSEFGRLTELPQD